MVGGGTASLAWQINSADSQERFAFVLTNTYTFIVYGAVQVL